MSVQVVFDHSGKIVDSIKKMISRAVYVGIPSDKPDNNRKPPDKIKNAALGAIHEYGSPKKNIPPRPFLMPAVRDQEEHIGKILRETAIATIGVGGDVDTALTFVGIAVQDAAKENIQFSKNMQELKQSTLAARRKKGFAGTDPLKVTGQLVNSIHYEVGDSGKS